MTKEEVFDYEINSNHSSNEEYIHKCAFHIQQLSKSDQWWVFLQKLRLGGWSYWCPAPEDPKYKLVAHLFDHGPYFHPYHLI